MSKPTPLKDNIALIAMHDVSPVFEDDVLATYDRLRSMGIDSFTLLITPQYGLKKSSSFESNVLFAEYVRSLDLEISLHGYAHQSKSGHESEFHKISKERLESRIKSGISALRKSLGIKPKGFIPPHWKSTRRLIEFTKQLGFKYCVSGTDLHFFKKNSKYSTADFIISQGTANGSFVNALVELELGGSVQIGVHPLDWRTGGMFSLLEDMKDRLDYKFIGYFDFLVSQ